MKKTQTPLGEVLIAPQNELFETFADILKEMVASKNYPPGVGLTGGSSPKAFFKWLTEHPEKLPEAKQDIVFSVSDERCVPVESEESNYGNAQRLFFDPFGVEMDNRFPWDTSRDPEEAAGWYGKLWSLSFGDGHTYDVCMLGMGDDCHTASLFPGSPLLQEEVVENGIELFAAVDVPGKGSRLTITVRGLEKSGKIVILVMGEGKANALATVFHGDPAPLSEVPIRLMSRFPEKVLWLIDEAAAKNLSL